MKYSKHIVFISPGFAKDEADYLCTPYLQDYFRALHAARPDWRISIVAMQYPYQAMDYQWHGLQVYAIGGDNRRLMKLWTWRKTRLLLQKLHLLQPIDRLHAFWLGEASACALQFGSTRGIPVIATAMGQDVLPVNRFLRRLDFGNLHTIGLSTFSARLLAKQVPGKPDVIIPFGLDPVDVDDRCLSDRPIDVLGVASLNTAKRLDRFVRVVNMLREQFPDLRAVLIGEGKERGNIEKLIAESGLQGHLELMKIMPRLEILDMMSRSKVFLHTSKIEGMGLVLAEALARGCHLVSTPVGVAEASDKCLISPHTYGLAEAAAHFLRSPVDWKPRVPYPISDTVDAHLRLYGMDGWD
jgi:1,2-diacylglycerol 3-alpha-glucosyltransferase